MTRRSNRSGADVPPFVPHTLTFLSPEDRNALEDALRKTSPISIRKNPRKFGGPEGTAIPWCDTGLYLSERPSFTLDPLLHAGAYYVQEASSMLLEQAWLRTGLNNENILALDLCAAPGGKSTHLASLLSDGSLLVCNEVMPGRQAALMENLWKQGRLNTMITGGRAQDLAAMEATFDLILVDAPCSGEGMFRKDPFARQQWNEGLVRSCARTQGGILSHAWKALKAGGYLMYSTCTWELAENEDQVSALIALGAEPMIIAVPEAWGVLASDHGSRCYPHRVQGEGFFIALLRKPGERTPSGSGMGPCDPPAPALSSWLKHPELLTTKELHGIHYASSRRWCVVIDRIERTIPVLASGLPVAEEKGRTIRPHAALALNEELDTAAFPSVDLELPRSLAYLRGETALSLPAHSDPGHGTLLVR
ncbi:MAG TPA: RsmB/NOP family class I SAM-dependent RNA methyltransferase, partial [Flavobacteriales bacterium]|nr:RsmB/NOP family class I SAM-dependent RNA methyltransferase [Flavobacteriales bacterium]